MPDKKKVVPPIMERRFLAESELRIADGPGGTRQIRGYAAVFDALSQPMMGFREIIRKGAFKKTLREADVRAHFNHDPNIVLGRNHAGTLDLREDDKGLLYAITPPDTQAAADLIKSIERGDVTQSSFAFQKVKDRWTEDKTTNTVTRELLEVKLFDVSPVTYPAYTQTDVHVRAVLDSFGISSETLAATLFKAQSGLALSPEERAAIAAIDDLLRQYLHPEPSESHSDDHVEQEPGASDARHSDQVDGRDLEVLLKRLQLVAV